MTEKEPLTVVDVWQKWKVLIYLASAVAFIGILLRILDALLRIETILNQP